MSKISLLTSVEMEGLVRRMDLLPQLLRRREEEAITQLVAVSAEDVQESELALLAGQSREAWLAAKGWSETDLELHLRRPIALNRFAQQQFAPGLEETFLASSASRDTVVYSLIRVRDRGLARELYLRLTEGELAFPEAARQFGEGPEARHQGVIGPMAMGHLQPTQLAEWLRSLQPGEILRPQALGDWHLLMRLEHLHPARLDDTMRHDLLREQLGAFLDERVRQLQAGEPLLPLHYSADHSDSASE